MFLFRIVRNLLRNCITVIWVAVAFIYGTNQLDSTILDSPIHESNSTIILCETEFLNSDSHYSHQTSSINILHLRRISQRTNNAYKNHFKFIKANRHSNIGIKNYIQTKFSSIHSPFVKIVHKLISLGKLII